jgi:hypothetical protein
MRPTDWTETEKAILREIYASGKIVEQLHRLPGRTTGAAWRQASKLGLKRYYPCDWTPEEDAILRDAYANGTPLKCALKNLPGRTHRGMRDRAACIGLAGTFNGITGTTYSWVANDVKRLLADGQPMSSRKLALLTYASLPSIHRVTNRLHGKEIYIADWENSGNGYAAIWALGNLEDAPKPTAIPISVRCRTYRRNKRVKAGKTNPFAAALGLVDAPKGEPGRIYIHLTDSKYDELECAA